MVTPFFYNFSSNEITIIIFYVLLDHLYIQLYSLEYLENLNTGLLDLYGQGLNQFPMKFLFPFFFYVFY